MNSLESLAAFFGWCTVLNYGLLVFMSTNRQDHAWNHDQHAFPIIRNVSEAELPRCYFQVLAHYQSLILAFSLAPYVALKLMS